MSRSITKRLMRDAINYDLTELVVVGMTPDGQPTALSTLPDEHLEAVLEHALVAVQSGARRKALAATAIRH